MYLLHLGMHNLVNYNRICCAVELVFQSVFISLYWALLAVAELTYFIAAIITITHTATAVSCRVLWLTHAFWTRFIFHTLLLSNYNPHVLPSQAIYSNWKCTMFMVWYECLGCLLWFWYFLRGLRCLKVTAASIWGWNCTSACWNTKLESISKKEQFICTAMTTIKPVAARGIQLRCLQHRYSMLANNYLQWTVWEVRLVLRYELTKLRPS